MQFGKWLLAVGSVSLIALPAFSQEPPAKPEPTAEHEALGMWVGKWAGKGEMKPGPFGPGGPMSWTEECSWFGDAKFHVVCKTKGTGPMGPQKGLGIMGYNPEKKVYVHMGIDTDGWTGVSEGTRDGDSWTFRSQETVGGKSIESRFTLRWETPTKMTFSWEISEDGTEWTAIFEGASEKQ